MKNLFFVVWTIIGVFVFTVLPAMSEEIDAEKHISDKTVPEAGVEKSGDSPVSKSLSENIKGIWIIASNSRITSGTLEFKTGGTYEMNEKYADGTGAGTKGQFTIDETAEPAKLKLCLGDCNQPGSEWVTRFCIVKMTGLDTMEIFQSKDSSYPTAFPDDKNTENYMVLSK